MHAGSSSRRCLNAVTPRATASTPLGAFSLQVWLPGLQQSGCDLGVVSLFNVCLYCNPNDCLYCNPDCNSEKETAMNPNKRDIHSPPSPCLTP